PFSAVPKLQENAQFSSAATLVRGALLRSIPACPCGPLRGSGRHTLSKRTHQTCDDCYFRRAVLCALPTYSPCPTFRLHSRGSLVPPRQPRLVPRPLRSAC